MNSDWLLGALVGGVLVWVLVNRKTASAATGTIATPFATAFPIYEAGGIAGPASSGCGCSASLCDVLTRY